MHTGFACLYKCILLKFHLKDISILNLKANLCLTKKILNKKTEEIGFAFQMKRILTNQPTKKKSSLKIRFIWLFHYKYLEINHHRLKS